jgi:hypothetical protein
MRHSVVALVLGFAVGCSSSDGDDDDHAADAKGGGGGASAQGGAAGTMTRAGAGGSAGGGAAAGSAVSGGSGGAAGTAALAGSGGGAGVAPGGAGGSAGQTLAGSGGSAGEPVDLLPLPEGSRELDGVVNLVSADAAAELEEYLNLTGTNPYWESSLPTVLNMFLEHYVEQYDFLYVYTDHELSGAGATGRFEDVTTTPMPGTGLDYAIEREGVKTNGRLRGVLGLNYYAGLFGPLAHETMHNWANNLDLSFGFGQGLDYEDPVHWGYAGVHGELGGFDPVTLECETPAGAKPPDCDSFGGGRYRYVVGAFGPFTNGPFQPYAPFENYLMGLVPRADVPNDVPVLIDGDLLEDSFDPATITMKIEAASVETVQVDDIVARHGEVKLLPEGQRGFTAAFVIVSATPVDDALLTEIGHWGAVWGGRETDPNVASFAGLTGNHGTMDTRLGPRRSASDPPPTLRTPMGCDIDAQDCGNGMGCYVVEHYQTACALSRGLARGAACEHQNDCAAGLACSPSTLAPDTTACAPYCNPDDSAANACASTCEWTAIDVDGTVVAGLCKAP